MRKFHKRYAYMVKVLKKLCNMKSKIIDCACGDGDGTPHLIQEGAVVTGIDIDKKLIKIARKTFPKVSFDVASITNLPSPDSEFDICICSETLEHLTKEESQQAAKEILRVIKPNGVICVTVPCNKKVCMSSKLHKQYLGHDALAELFSECEILHYSIFYKNPKRKNRGNRVIIFRKTK